jgi:hypothetical protein
MPNGHRSSLFLNPTWDWESTGAPNRPQAGWNPTFETSASTPAGNCTVPPMQGSCRLKIEQPLFPTTGNSQTPTVGAANNTTAARSNAGTNVRYSKNTKYNPLDETTPSSDDWKKDRYYDFTTRERDEGNGVCPSYKVSEIHTQRTQEVFVEIDVAGSDGLVTKTQTTTAKS